MRNFFSTEYRRLSLLTVAAFVLTSLAVLIYTGSSGGLGEAASIEDHGSAIGNGISNLPGDQISETSPVTNLLAGDTYTARFVYSDNNGDESAAERTYNGDEPGEDDPDPVQSTINETIKQDEKATGQVDVPDGASIKIEKKPSNGKAVVDDDGNWEYTPDSGFTGKDQFTMVIEDDSDLVIEVITAKITVEKAKADDDDTLPDSGGLVFGSIIALWLFVIASKMLRAGIIIT